MRRTVRWRSVGWRRIADVRSTLHSRADGAMAGGEMAMGGELTAGEMTAEVRALVEELGLVPHPEGGFYRETYRSQTTVTRTGAGGAARAASTAIYFLLARGQLSALHRVASDEVWHHYAGDAIALHIIEREMDGDRTLHRHRVVRLGCDVARGERPQAVVPAGALQAAVPAPVGDDGGGHGYALCGCTVAPGFEFADFELPSRAALLAEMPSLGAVITMLTRE